MFQRFIPINREHVTRVLLSGLHAFGNRNSSTTEQALVNSEVGFFYFFFLQTDFANINYNILISKNLPFVHTSEVEVVMVGLDGVVD